MQNTSRTRAEVAGSLCITRIYDKYYNIVTEMTMNHFITVHTHMPYDIYMGIYDFD